MQPHAGRSDPPLEMKSNLRIHITVRGQLSRRLTAAFDGLTPVPGAGTTELTGEVVDQAQLYGLLTRVRDLGLELQSVTVFDTRAESSRPRSVVRRNTSAPKPRCAAPNTAVRNKANKLQGGLP
jgi:hypothetical protein